MSRPQASTLPKIETGRRLYSLEQANRALVLVRRITADIVSLYRQVIDLQECFDALQTQNLPAEAEKTQRELIGGVDRLQSFADELTDLGLELRDWELGVIDFPAEAEGRRIVFCWQFDGDRIEHFHDIDADCASRRPVAELDEIAQAE